MVEALEKIRDRVLEVQSVEEYSSVINDATRLLVEKGYCELAGQIKEASCFMENKFSKAATHEAWKKAKDKVVCLLENTKEQNDSLSNENNAMIVTEKILQQFKLYCQNLFRNHIHGKCSESLKTNLKKITIENEYDLHQLMFPLFVLMFPDARTEEVEDSGHHMVRKDIVIDSFDIAIELKCSSASMTERSISEEIAADMIHYSNKNLFFYIYDKDNVIKNVNNFKKVYENKHIDEKRYLLRLYNYMICNLPELKHKGVLPVDNIVEMYLKKA